MTLNNKISTQQREKNNIKSMNSLVEHSFYSL